MGIFFETILIFAIPAIVMLLEEKTDAVKKLGAITICYALGFCIAITNFTYDKDFSETLASSVISIAIPIMLFKSDIRLIKKVGKKMLMSFILISVTVMVASVIAAFVGNSSGIAYTAQLSGMATGLYIGGTQNLFAVGKAFLKNDFNLINSAYIADTLMGGIYFLLLISTGKRIYAKVLGKTRTLENRIDFGEADDCDKHKGKILFSLLMGVLCFGTGVLIEYSVNGNFEGSFYIILTVSILGILFSFIKPIRDIKGSEKISSYLILVFSFGLSLSLNVNEIGENIVICLIYFGSIMFSSVIIHFILCKVLKIDGGTSLVASVAAIYGPPFVVTAADAYGDRSLIAPGIICGITGLVFGNFLGIGIGKFLMLII